jgi:hypothetical protein
MNKNIFKQQHKRNQIEEGLYKYFMAREEFGSKVNTVGNPSTVKSALLFKSFGMPSISPIVWSLFQKGAILHFQDVCHFQNGCQNTA